MSKDFLSDFEELILTMVAIMHENAYGAAISIEVEKCLHRKVTLSAVHVALYGLEDKGYIKSRVGGATSERGGRRKRIYTITRAGVAVLKAMKDTRTGLWKLVPQFNFTNA